MAFAIRNKSSIYRNQKPVSGSRFIQSCLTIINISIILTCTFVLIWQGNECLSRWVSRETKAILTVKATGEASFLAFTVCPAFDDAYKKDLFQTYATTKDNYVFSANFTTNSTSLEGTKVFEKLTFSLDEILYMVKISTASNERSKIVIDFRTNFINNTDATFFTKYDQTFGRCFSMELQPTTTRLGVTKIEFFAHLNIYIYLHHPGQFMDLDSKSKVYALMGKKYFIDVVYDISENTLEEAGDMPCNSALNFTYDECLYLKIAQDLAANFGCSVPFLPPYNLNKTEICHNLPDKNVYREVLDRYSYLSSNGQRSLCEMPCSTMEVFLGLPFNGTDEKAYIKLYLKSTVKMKKTVYDYTFLSLIAEIGGYTGLLLGVSCVNLTSLIDRFAMRMIQK